MSKTVQCPYCDRRVASIYTHVATAHETGSPVSDRYLREMARWHLAQPKGEER